MVSGSGHGDPRCPRGPLSWGMGQMWKKGMLVSLSQGGAGRAQGASLGHRRALSSGLSFFLRLLLQQQSRHLLCGTPTHPALGTCTALSGEWPVGWCPAVPVYR